MTSVAQPQQMASLTRTLRVGDELSVDNGRVVVKVEGIDRKRSTVNFRIDRKLSVDKPPKKPPG
jgi:pyruvate kinase